MARRPAVLFVCTGNICRSPMAEAVAQAVSARLKKPLHVESAGTGEWHVGEPPDPRAVKIAGARGYDLAAQRARAVADEDFERFDHLVALAANHKRWLLDARSARRRRERPVSLLMDWSSGLAGTDVPDPYYEDEAAFERALDLIEKGCEGLVRRV